MTKCDQAVISTQKLHKDVQTKAVASDLSSNKKPLTAPEAKNIQTLVKWNINASKPKQWQDSLATIPLFQGFPLQILCPGPC